MSPPDDTPLAARLARWSERWFTPRWRALLTWLALTAISAAVYHANVDRFETITRLPMVYLENLLQAPLPPVFGAIGSGLTFSLLLIWFEPLAMRLSLVRGLAWICVPLVGEILRQFLLWNSAYDGEWTWHVIEFGSATLQCWVLRGCRSRPWMCLPAQAAVSALWLSEPLQHFDLPYWFLWAVYELPHAALLLYGTRLLRPEERAPSGAAE